MKKLIVTSAFAVALLAMAQGKAQAWNEFKFSAGFDIQYRGGGNRFLWGLCESSPFPACGPDAAMCGPFGCPPCGPAGCYPGMVPGVPCNLPGAGAAPAKPADAKPGVKPASASFQPVGYSNPAGYAYPSYNSSYGYPGAYGNAAWQNYQVPSYWYGN